MRAVIEKHLNSRLGKNTINLLMLAFFVLWGIESFVPLSPLSLAQLGTAKDIINGIFFIELALRIYVYRGQFFQKMFPVKLPKKPLQADDASSR